MGGYQGLVKKYLHAIPSKTQQGNWTAKPQCYMPRRDAFHIFRSFGSGDIPWPGLILGATAVSLFYGCADQVIKCKINTNPNVAHVCVYFGLTTWD